MRFHENEEAVSPVIGVILMVAITVILAAVIAVFVFGMAGEVQSTKSVGVSAKLDNSDEANPDFVITYQGGSDHNNVNYLSFKAGNDPAVYSVTGGTTDPAVGNALAPDVGDKFTVDVDADEITAGGPYTIVVIAKFADGTEQVIYDSAF